MEIILEEVEKSVHGNRGAFPPPHSPALHVSSHWWWKTSLC